MIEYRISRNTKILFVGINPHHGSDRRGVPFSNNKMFWYILSMAGAIEEDRDYIKDDQKLRHLYYDLFSEKYGLSLVNLVDRPTRDVSELRSGEEKEDKLRLDKIIQEYAPRVVCFVGKVTYEKFSGTKKFNYGWNGNLYKSGIYVMHFPLRGKASVRVEEIRAILRAVENSGNSTSPS